MKRSMASRILVSLGLASVLLGASSLTLASGFQLWEQNGAGTGDYHAGAAADADDASTAFYNPAGLTRLKGPQVVAGSAFVNLITTFKGNMVFTSAPFDPHTFSNIRASGGVLKAVPFGYFAMPINQKLAVGFGILAPFGLETDYSRKTPLRLAATKTQLQVIDFTPNIAYQFTHAFSLGAGLDFAYVKGTFDQMATVAFGSSYDSSNDTQSDNSGTGYGYGYHLGALYQFTPRTRVGVAYHSQIFVSMKGTSTFTGNLANGNAGEPNGVQKSKHLKTSVALPPYLVLSGIYSFNSHWAALSSLTYTWWSSFSKLRLRNVAAQDSDGNASNSLIINVLEKYRNTWNLAVGAHYSPTDKLTLKMGGGYDVTPTNGKYRNVQLPGQTHYALAAGIHYQLLKKLGVDVGYAHFFVRDANIHNTQTVGGETIVPNGVSRTSLNIYALQLTWDV